MTGIRVLAVMLAAAGVAASVTACAGDPEPPAGAPAQTQAAEASAGAEDWGDPPAVAAGGRSAPACDLPVTFDIAAKWLPKPVSAEVAEAFGGPDRVACEVDAKPAGILGFVRVYLAAQADPRAALQARASGSTDQRFREITTPAGAGWEIGYRAEETLGRAFAVAAGAGTVVVEWRGVDEDEHRAGLPAYVLARTSLARRS